uniref:Lysozyme n=2 Tax=Bursaphelenchus xylophilus TaxID=6326 RepID=A0A1I7RWV7_BURXY
MSKFLIALLAVAANAAPLQKDAKIAALLHGIDTTAPLSDQQLGCLFRSGFTAGFFRIGVRGGPDTVGVENVIKATNAKLSYEVFIAPNPSLKPDSQFSSAYNYARGRNLTPSRVWLQVTSPISWDRNQANNIRFIVDFIRAAQRSNIKVGLYTNWYDYEQITGNSRAISNTDIWYWHVNAPGPYGEQSPEHSDYRPFGPFTGAAKAKQYAIGATNCGVVLNKDSFPANLKLQHL